MSRAGNSQGQPLLGVEDLSVHFQTEDALVRAVEGVSFDLARGEMLGLVGESGCGKTATSLGLLGLLPQPAGRVASGRVLFDGRDLARLPQKALRAVRGRQIAMIFQDPMMSLNPYLRLGAQLTEGPRLHLGTSARDARLRALGLLERVGLPDAEQRLRCFPHELSGGMRQRVMIAMALMCEPDLLIADEPTTALDVTIQAQILELFEELRAERGTSVLFITHDLAVVSGLCDRVVVMYAGRVVEEAPSQQLFERPLHPYTEALLSAVPVPDPRVEATRARIRLDGEVPSPTAEIRGCAFRSRCRKAFGLCAEKSPGLKEHAPGHWAACHLPEAEGTT